MVEAPQQKMPAASLRLTVRRSGDVAVTESLAASVVFDLLRCDLSWMWSLGRAAASVARPLEMRMCQLSMLPTLPVAKLRVGAAYSVLPQLSAFLEVGSLPANACSYHHII